jgi:hypothetical protein
MQVNQIQRPSLIEPFFDKELIWNNEYLTYIITSVNKVVTSTANNIKTSLKNAKNVHSALIILGKGMKKLQRELRESEFLTCKKDDVLRADMREIHKLRRVFRKLENPAVA